MEITEKDAEANRASLDTWAVEAAVRLRGQGYDEQEVKTQVAADLFASGVMAALLADVPDGALFKALRDDIRRFKIGTRTR